MAYKKNDYSTEQEEVRRLKDRRAAENSREPQFCKDARIKIKNRIGHDHYISWFSLSGFSKLDDMLVIESPNVFTLSKQIDIYSSLLDELFGEGKWKAFVTSRTAF